MNKSLLSGVIIGAVVATAGGAIAGYNVLGNKAPTHADVTGVKELYKTERIPREECRDVPVTRQQPVQDQHRITGTVAGAVVGGVLGNQVGGGSGKKLATIAGAAAGGYAGNKTQEQMQRNNTYTSVERRCETRYDERQRLTGYQVDYRIGEQTGTVTMDHNPGERIPLQDGQLVLSRGGS